MSAETTTRFLLTVSPEGDGGPSVTIFRLDPVYGTYMPHESVRHSADVSCHADPAVRRHYVGKTTEDAALDDIMERVRSALDRATLAHLEANK